MAKIQNTDAGTSLLGCQVAEVFICCRQHCEMKATLEDCLAVSHKIEYTHHTTQNHAPCYLLKLMENMSRLKLVQGHL